MENSKAARVRVYKQDGQVSALQWQFYESADPATAQPYMKKRIWTREQYEQWANTTAPSTLSFEDFVKVFRIFIMGKHGTSTEIREAFQILDTNHSSGIDLNKLAVFMRFIIEGDGGGAGNSSCWEMLTRHVRKVHPQDDLNLNFPEFNNLIMNDIAVDIVLGPK
jgi:hypothetical protein